MTSTRGAKAAKEETALLTPDLIAGMMKKQSKEITKELTAAMKECYQEIDVKLEKVLQSIAENEERLGAVEIDLVSVNDRIEKLETRCEEMDARNLKLTSRVIDLESRSRRHNIRILGLKEDSEKGQLTDFFSKLLMEVFGKEFFVTEPLLDRAHRSLIPKPTSENRPRSVILRFHYFQEKERVIREARRNKNLNYLGQQIRFVEDFCPEVMEMRRKYRDVMAALYNKGLRPALLYPARLRITMENGRKKFLDSVEDAHKVLADSVSTSSPI